MRIALLVNLDLASCAALHMLLPALRGDTCRILATAQVGRPDAAAAALDLVKFAEHDFPFLFLAREHARGAWRTLPELAAHHRIPFEIVNNINRPAPRAALAGWGPDVVVSIRHGRILKNEVLALPPLGVLNLHSGLLPDYRGVMATFHAMRAGETTIGTTLHYIDDPAIDTGRIIARSYLPVDPTESYLHHTLSLYPGGVALIRDALARLRAGEALPTSEQTGGRYFGFPSDADVADFRARGLRLVNRRDLHRIAAYMGAVAGSERDSSAPGPYLGL